MEPKTYQQVLTLTGSEEEMEVIYQRLRPHFLVKRSPASDLDIGIMRLYRVERITKVTLTTCGDTHTLQIIYLRAE